MSDLRMYSIVVFAAKIKMRPATQGPMLLVDDDTKEISLNSESEAESYGKAMAERNFPVAGGWKTLVSVTEMAPASKGKEPDESDETFKLSQDYLDRNFANIKSNPVWGSTLGFDASKKPSVQVELILAFMKKSPSIIMDHQPVLPKERGHYWSKIETHIGKYIESDEAAAKSADK